MKTFSAAFQFAFVLLVGCVPEYLAQGPNFGQCRFRHEVRPGQVLAIRNTNYPNAYPNGQSCQHQVVAPNGYQVNLDCTIDRVGAVANGFCSNDYMDVSRSGDLGTNTDQAYCGSTNFIVNSHVNRIAFSQISRGRSGSYYCRAYCSPGCDCGRGQNLRIVGGTAAVGNEQPSACALVDANNRLRCGCTLINSRQVLTAGHCVAGFTGNLTAVLGTDNIATRSGRFAAAYPVSSVRLHEGYNAETNANDISILTLSMPVVMSERVGPACLPWSLRNRNLSDETVTAYGYGSTSFGGPRSNTLQKVNLNIVPPTLCQQLTSPLGIRVTASQLCTFAPGRDTCQYDSGGSMIYRNPYNGLSYQLCIPSSGYGCATNVPAICTSVVAYLDWIARNIFSEETCNA